MLYEDPKDLLQQKLNEALRPAEETIVSDLIALSLLQKCKTNKENLVFSELYNLLGLDTFTAMIQLLGGKTITFPSKESFKDTILSCLCYYYRAVEGKSWEEVKSLVMEPDLQSVRYGIRNKQFDAFLKAMMEKHLGVKAVDLDRLMKNDGAGKESTEVEESEREYDE